MAVLDNKRTPIRALSVIFARLTERADTIEHESAQIAYDLRIGGLSADLLAFVRHEISEIAARCKDVDAARELRDLLADDATEPATEAPKTDHPEHPPLDYETLVVLSGRLITRAGYISSDDRFAADLRLAAHVAGRFGGLRIRISEIAAKAIEHPEWDNAALARDLRAALDDATEGK
jgi:hypothetical protein